MNKTKPTTVSVADYIASRANEEQMADCKTLMALFKKLTQHLPKMWGPSIVGYGSCRDGKLGALYLAYVRDPDDNKLCALHRPAAAR